MDSMIQSYMEETEEMLQRAEECIIRLEMEYSTVEINELFRIAHTIKGSSHMVGYEDIGNLMHKIEDMLVYARKGLILFDQSIVSLCFEGLDTVKKMLQYKKEPGSKDLMDKLVNSAVRIGEMVEAFIRVNKKEEVKPIEPELNTGIVSSLLNNVLKGNNKFYITFFFEEDAPMVSPVVIMVLNGVADIGSLVFSSVTDNYFSENSSVNETKSFDIIISTDIEEAELYTYFALMYIEKINIVDLSRDKVEGNDYSFSDSDNSLYITIWRAYINLYKLVDDLTKELTISEDDINLTKYIHSQTINSLNMQNKNNVAIIIKDFNQLVHQIARACELQSNPEEELISSIYWHMTTAMERVYNYTKGKRVFCYFKAGKYDLINRLKTFVERLNKTSTFILLIDLSKLTILLENEVKALIEIKRQLEAQQIEVGIIAAGEDVRPIINIFDSINEVENFLVSESPLDAIMGIIKSDDSFNRIIKKLKDMEQ